MKEEQLKQFTIDLVYAYADRLNIGLYPHVTKPEDDNYLFKTLEPYIALIIIDNSLSFAFVSSDVLSIVRTKPTGTIYFHHALVLKVPKEPISKGIEAYIQQSFVPMPLDLL